MKHREDLLEASVGLACRPRAAGEHAQCQPDCVWCHVLAAKDLPSAIYLNKSSVMGSSRICDTWYHHSSSAYRITHLSATPYQVPDTIVGAPTEAPSEAEEADDAEAAGGRQCIGCMNGVGPSSTPNCALDTQQKECLI